MKKVIKKDSVRVDGSASPGPAHATKAAQVRLIRLEGRVHSIELTCRCGEVSILELEYDAAAQETEVTS